MRVVLIAAVIGIIFSGAIMAQDSMMSAPSKSDGSTMMMSAARPNKVLFTDLEAAQMLAAEGPTVLFFAADWCPTCQAAMKELDSEAARLGDITVVVVNYDRASDLKRKYGISYQHTYVQIDAEGNKIALWNGGGIDGVLKNVVRASR